MRNSIVLTMSLFLPLMGCISPEAQQTKQFKENPKKTVFVKDRISDIQTPIFFSFADLLIMDDILIVNELNPVDARAIHLFKSDNFEYITSTGFIGKGPGEITRIGRPAIDSWNNILWVSDHGKQVRWKFPLDSILNNENFIPTEKYPLNDDLFLVDYRFLNDSIAIGRAAHPTSFHSMDITTAKLNLRQNKIERFGYVHPDLKDRESYSFFNLSRENNLYVTCYTYVDLMTICNLDGSLRCNVYGSNWSVKEKKGNKYFTHSDTFKDNIIAAYIGGRYVFDTEDGGKRIASTTRLLVFDADGNYEQTIETGHEFSTFCIDEKNQRVICYFEDRDNPLGYFDLVIK